MKDKAEYSVLDQPGVVEHLFHPRKESRYRAADVMREDFFVPVADGIRVGASLHLRNEDAPFLIFFHGNGEIVSDYDELGPLFSQRAGVNFFVADYRGYGVSNGYPGVANMMSDARKVLAFAESLRSERRMKGPFNVMGRSLGSAPALELAACSGTVPNSLILESGFAWAGPLLRMLGLDPDALGFEERDGTGNLAKMGTVESPCLIIHGENDRLIPFRDAQALFDACPAQVKHLLKIEGAGHNDLFLCGMTPYLDQVRRFCSRS